MGQAATVCIFEEPAPQAMTIASTTAIIDSQEGRHGQSQGLSTSDRATPPDIPDAALNTTTVRQALSELAHGSVQSRCGPSVQPSANPLSGPLASLLDDPGFGSSPNLGQWAKGSEAERRSSLETFMCHSIQDDNFFKLCKDLDGIWQRVFFGKVV